MQASKFIYLVSVLQFYCFTEIIRTIRDGEPKDGHLDFHAAPELCLEVNCTPVLSVLPPGGVVGSLNMECYNRTQPRLRECEDRYGPVSYTHLTLPTIDDV